MANLYEKRVRLEAKKFNKLRTKLAPVGITGELLLKDGFDGTYSVSYTLHDWWYFKNKYTREMVVRVATLDQDFIDALETASDVKIEHGSFQTIFEINKRDINHPNFKTPYWEILSLMNFENM